MRAVFRGVVVAALLVSPCFGQDADATYKVIAPERLEALAKKLGHSVTRKAGAREGDVVLELHNKAGAQHLHSFGGKELRLAVLWPQDLPLERVNAWNQDAKFSRALIPEGMAKQVLLEAYLDLTPGVTDAMVQQFLARFQSEHIRFTLFLKK